MSVSRKTGFIGVALLTAGIVFATAACGESSSSGALSEMATTAPSSSSSGPDAAYVHKSMADFAADDAGDAEAGQHLFAEVCAPCHNQSARGIEGIGVDLTRSEFVGTLTPVQLATFVDMGLSINSPFNESNIRMPPRGGRDDLSSEDLLNIATYLKSINSSDETAAARAHEYLIWLQNGGEEQIASTPEVSSEGLSGAALDGQTTYLRYCAVCHGPNGEGVESLGKSFRGGKRMPTLTDEELANVIRMGLSTSNPRNVTGIEMLPNGGQPGLADEEMSMLIAYLRVVNTQELLSPLVADESTDGGASSDDAGLALLEASSPTCYTCHVVGDRGNKDGPGTDLSNIGALAGERIPGMDAHAYLEQSLLKPGEFIVEECPRGPCLNAMPNYRDAFTDEELETLITFLLSLEGE